MTTPLRQVIREQRAELLAEWLHHAESIWSGDSGERHQDPLPHEPSLRLHALFDDIVAALEQPATENFTLDTNSSLTEHLNQFVSDQARRSGGSSKTIGLVLALKHLLSERLIAQSTDSLPDLMWIERVFDSLILMTFSAFVDVREHLITQQSLSLMELSTPVLRLWNRILMLPLVGVIDTVRARLITESLLEAIAHHEARVTIIDLTGVPVLDTSVAQHLMKTIDASRLLGTRIVLTGISPEGAQTLTKLGIRFGDVISRATLRAGIAEALLIIGQRIGPTEERRS